MNHDKMRGCRHQPFWSHRTRLLCSTSPSGSLLTQHPILIQKDTHYTSRSTKRGGSKDNEKKKRHTDSDDKELRGSEGTPAMGLGHMNVVLSWLMCMKRYTNMFVVIFFLLSFPFSISFFFLELIKCLCT